MRAPHLHRRRLRQHARGRGHRAHGADHGRLQAPPVRGRRRHRERNDDTDVPEDRNPCTNDVCTTGVPSHTMMPANSNCGGANHCNANGQCVGCAVAADCPGTDTACRTRTCSTAGVCGFNFTATNTKLVDPTAGDCKGLQCDGAGNAQIFNDSADLPVDGNMCTTDECSSSGTPFHRPVGPGRAAAAAAPAQSATARTTASNVCRPRPARAPTPSAACAAAPRASAASPTSPPGRWPRCRRRATARRASATARERPARSPTTWTCRSTATRARRTSAPPERPAIRSSPPASAAAGARSATATAPASPA